MPVPFGVSVGDFVACINLIHSVVQALEESGGSRAHFQSIITTLKSLDSALQQIKDCYDSVEDRASIGSVVSSCEHAIKQFLIKVQKYEGTLGEGTRSKCFKARSRAIQWRLYSKDGVAEFQQTILIYTAVLQQVLVKLNRTHAQANYEETTQRLAQLGIEHTNGQRLMEDTLRQISHDIQSRDATLRQWCLDTATQHTHDHGKVMRGIEQSIAMQSNTRLDLLSSIEKLKSEVDDQQTALATFTVTVMAVLSSIRQLGLQILTANLFLILQLRSLHRVVSAIPKQISDAAVHFTDAHNFRRDIHINTIRTWRAFHVVVHDNFLVDGLPGSSRVMQQLYKLHDRYSNKDLDTSMPFQSVFRPGRLIDMSIVFGLGEVKFNSARCLRCGNNLSTRERVESVCPSCSFVCHQLKSLPDRAVNATNHDDGQTVHSETSSSTLAPRSGKKRKYVETEAQPQPHEDSPADFCRVSVVTRHMTSLAWGSTCSVASDRVKIDRIYELRSEDVAMSRGWFALAWPTASL